MAEHGPKDFRSYNPEGFYFNGWDFKFRISLAEGVLDILGEYIEIRKTCLTDWRLEALAFFQRPGFFHGLTLSDLMSDQPLPGHGSRLGHVSL